VRASPGAPRLLTPSWRGQAQAGDLEREFSIVN
jgi:hypothetical protein